MSPLKYFFCGIGGSGMLPLAVILKGQGAEIFGSDRSHDQGRTSEKFDAIMNMGMVLCPQDGSGLQNDMVLVVSSAIEDSIPEVAKAKAQSILILKRAELLASLFNKAKTRVAIAGTSGKSTTTGMLGFILNEAGKTPTVMNGAVFKNFVSAENPFATALSGSTDLFITEADESDGSIELYQPTIAVLNNISLDHKSIEELRSLFAKFVERSEKAVVNLDNVGAAAIAKIYAHKCVTYSLQDKEADLYVSDIEPRADGIHCLLNDKYALNLNIAGRHNVSNALAAIAAAELCGVSIKESCKIIAGFSGVKRRLETIGTRNNITVIDDFAHNPDKIEATLQTLKEFEGRLIVIFQMHGFGPLKLMHAELAQSFKKYLAKDDMFFMPEVLYLGGTADRSYTAKDFVVELKKENVNAKWFETRADILPDIQKFAKGGDRIIVMGARDDTLSEFAKELLAGL